MFGHKNADGSDNLVAIIELVNRNGGVFTAHDLVSSFIYFRIASRWYLR